MNLAFHRSLREEFLAIAKAEPDRCVVIDASNNTERVATDVWAAVRAKFKL
jgi:dTMP kinase